MLLSDAPLPISVKRRDRTGTSCYHYLRWPIANLFHQHGHPGLDIIQIKYNLIS
jgi:hypothetical protein